MAKKYDWTYNSVSITRGLLRGDENVGGNHGCSVDLLYISSHGDASPALLHHRWPNPPYERIIYPLNGPSSRNIEHFNYLSQNHVENDLEWVILAACYQLKFWPFGSYEGCWGDTLIDKQIPNIDSDKHHLHGILGYWDKAPSGQGANYISRRFVKNLANKRIEEEGGGNNTIISAWIDANIRHHNDGFCIYIHKDCLNDDLNYFYNEPFGNISKKDYLVIFCAKMNSNNSEVENNAWDEINNEWRDGAKIFCKYNGTDYLLDSSTVLWGTVHTLKEIEHLEMLQLEK